MSSANARYDRGDVVWSVDPFKLGKASPRLWLIISDDRHPFYPDQYIAVAVTTSHHLVSHPLRDEYWEVGGTPKPSFVSPWAVHSPRRTEISAPPQYQSITNPWQGRVTQSFVDKVVAEHVNYVQ